jgi:hypothetical protein
VSFAATTVPREQFGQNPRRGRGCGVIRALASFGGATRYREAKNSLEVAIAISPRDERSASPRRANSKNNDGLDSPELAA